MRHLGDICKIHNAPNVWIVCGGSPCQDLSVAGLRKGLKHSDKGDEETTRSGLFMEQIRVTKEMRENDRRNGRAGKFIRPRFFVWENVPGALSSGTPAGEDFRIVLEEVARIADHRSRQGRSRGMTNEEAKAEIRKVFEPAFANYIITALTEGATLSERKTGKWVHGREIWREHIGDAIVGIGYEDWRCSECNTLVKDNASGILWKYCPWCGAKMEGAEE